ncbi:MAG: hypothetical protein WC916_03875 [Candidatus Woesearchaeota archaeon]
MKSSPIYGLLLINEGLEEHAKLYIRTLVPATIIATAPGMLIMSVLTIEDLCELAYRTQLCNQVFLIVKRFVQTKNTESTEIACILNDLLTTEDKTLLKKIVQPHATMRMIIKSKQMIDTPEYEREIGGTLKTILEEEGIPTTVNLKHPHITAYTFMDIILEEKEHTLLCIDISGDIAKREYRVFNSSMSLKGTTAFGVLMIAGYQPTDVMFDPYCNSGTLIIEAALYASKMSPWWYRKEFPFHQFACFKDKDWDKFYAKIDKEHTTEKLPITGSDPLLRNITAACKNAKVAGVEKQVHFRRIDTDWLDIKMEESSVDKIITFIPGSSKHKSHQKEYKEFFYQAEYIIKPKGLITILCITKEQLLTTAEEFVDFVCEKLVYSGQQALWVLCFKKRAKTKGKEKNK